MVATKSTDNIDKKANQAKFESKNRLRLLAIRSVFLITWLCFSGTIFIIAILTNINWMRPGLEEIMDRALQRNVKLGRLSWHFGLRGLSVESSRILIAERSGAPFLMAGQCQIGFAPWPLLSGKGQISFIDMQNPLFMAIRTAEDHWNFDDLLVVSPDIELIQCRRGHVFVVDRADEKAPSHFPDTELNNVEIKLQQAGQFFPARTEISFDLPGQTPVAHLRAESALWHGDKSWFDRKCHLQVASKHFNLQNWQTVESILKAENTSYSYNNLLASLIAKINDNKEHRTTFTLPANLIPSSGKLDLTVTADGVPSTKLNIDTQISAEDLLFADQTEQAPVNVPQVSITGHLEIRDNSLLWKKVTTRIPEYKLLFNSSGQRDKTTYQGNFTGLLGDLKKLNPIIALAYKTFNKEADKNIDFKNLDGKLFLDCHFSGNGKKTYVAEAKMADINVKGGLTPALLSINKINKNNSLRDLSMKSLEKYWQQLGLSDKAKFSGTMLANSDEGCSFKDCRLEDGPINWKLSGQTDKDGQWKELIFDNQDLPLEKISDRIKRDNDFAAEVRQILGIASNCQIRLGGKAKINVKLSQINAEKQASGLRLSCESVLNDASAHFSEPHLDIYHLNGTFTFANNGSILKNIRFNTATGAMSIDAGLPGKGASSSPVNFHLHAKSTSFSELYAVLQLFHLDIKYLDNWQMLGKLKEFDLLINGPANSPKFALTAIPEDLSFVLPNTKQAIRALSGKIVYANDILSLEKVNLSTVNSRALVTLTARNISGTPKLDKFNIVAESNDLSNIQAILTSSLMPPYWHNLFNTFSKQYQINNLTGNILASLEMVARRGQQNIEGTVIFNNMDLRCGTRRLALHGMKGSLFFIDNDMIFRDIAGSVGDTSFTMRGRLLNYGKPSAQWRGELNAQVTPDHLNDICSLVAPTGQMSLSAQKAISIKVKRSLRPNNSPLNTFNLIADPGAGLNISLGDLHIHQPEQKKFSVNGSLDWNEQQIAWHNFNLDFGGSLLVSQGVMKSANKSSQSRPVLDCVIQLPDFFSADLFTQIFANNQSDIRNGQVKGTLSLHGQTDNLQLNGKLVMQDVALPSIYLNHLTGSLLFDPSSSSSSSFNSTLQLQQMAMGPISLSNVSGAINFPNGIDSTSLLSPNSSGNGSQIFLNDFKANLAQGQLIANGQADLKQKKYHLDLNVKEANLARLWPQIISSQGIPQATSQIGVSGLLSCRFNLETYGNDTKELEQNISGSGEIHIGKGSFGRSGQLHARLNQVNLIHQGIFGFNINNVLQSVLPAKNSDFNSIDAALVLNEETLIIRHLLYDGRDMKFSAAGKANFALHSLELDVAGIMPRVSSSVIVGPIGEISREITLQKLLDAVTMHKLEKLPSLPVIGGLAGPNEVFTCRIIAPYDQPKSISQSIEKSFHWVQNPSSHSAKKTP